MEYLPSFFGHFRKDLFGLAACVNALRSGLYEALFLLLIVVHVRAVLQRPWLAMIFTVLLVSPMYVPFGNHPLLSFLLIACGCVALIVAALMRFGLVTAASSLLVIQVMLDFPITLDLRVWYADLSLLALLVAVGLVLFGFVNAWKAAPDFARASP